MSDMQLYFAVGVPSLIALVGILVNTSLFIHLSTRVSSIESKLEDKISSLESKTDAKFDMLIGKIGEMDVRLARLGDRMAHWGQR